MMIIYYTGFNSQMKKFSSIGLFKTLDELKNALKNKNKILIQYKIVNLSSFNKNFSNPTTEEIILFFQELSLMLKSGLSLSLSLSLLETSSKNYNFKSLIHHLLSNIKCGNNLAFSIQPMKNILSPFYLNLIIIGEESGNLPETLEIISQNLKKNFILQKKLKSLFVYPIFVFILTIVLSIILINFVLPEFVKIFNESNIQLPFLTLILLKIYTIISNYPHYLIFGLLFLSSSVYIFSCSEKGKNTLYRILTFSFPIYRLYSCVFLLKNLSLLLNSGTPLFSSLKTLQTIEKNPILKLELETIIENLKNGNMLNSSIKNSLFFSQTVTSMISVGEESGNLPYMISNASELVYSQFNEQLETLLVFIEPVTLILLGGIIGVIILGLYLPIFDSFSMIK